MLEGSGEEKALFFWNPNKMDIQVIKLVPSYPSSNRSMARIENT
jgi:hypothetical protein